MDPLSLPFVDTLALKVRERETPVLVGLDPRIEALPEAIVQGFDMRAPSGRAEAILCFCRGVIDVVASRVPAVKPQAAFFEELGPEGMSVLAEVIRYAQSEDLLVILDGKRNDIGSTATAYAQGWLGRGRSAWGADALTVSPYLGDDSLQPFLEVAVDRSAGVFCLVKTSNPGGAMLQDLAVEGGELLYRKVAQHVERLAARTAGACGFGACGAVVGATWPEQLRELREAMPHAWLLIPGFGSQGGTAKDVAGGFHATGQGAIVNSSRGIIFAYQRAPYADRFGQNQWQDAVEAATLDMIDQLRSDTPAGRLSS